MFNSFKFQTARMFVKVVNFTTKITGFKATLSMDVTLKDEIVVREMDKMIAKCKNANLSSSRGLELIQKELNKQSVNLVGWEDVFKNRWDLH